MCRDTHGGGPTGRSASWRQEFRGVALHLTPLGCERLGFADSIRLVWPEQLAGRAKALKQLEKMQRHAYGRVVQIDKGDTA
jgi:hypothetical protein